MWYVLMTFSTLSKKRSISTTITVIFTSLVFSTKTEHAPLPFSRTACTVTRSFTEATNIPTTRNEFIILVQSSNKLLPIPSYESFSMIMSNKVSTKVVSL